MPTTQQLFIAIGDLFNLPSPLGDETRVTGILDVLGIDSDLENFEVIELSEDGSFSGGAGNQFVFGSIGDDTISGGDDSDIILSDRGSDVVFGREGNDLLAVRAFSFLGDEIFIDGGTGDDVIIVEGGAAVSEVFGGAGNDDITGGFTRDVIDAGTGSDEVLGGRGDDLVLGGAGADDLNGQDDNDVLIGGGGRDTLTGGRDDDTFVFSGGDGRDVITDFGLGDDVPFEGNPDGPRFFNPNPVPELGLDTIVIDRDGFDSFDDLDGRISESGGDLVIRLGGGDRITISGRDDLEIADLNASNVLFAAADDFLV